MRRNRLKKLKPMKLSGQKENALKDIFKHSRKTAVMHVSATVFGMGYTFEMCKRYHTTKKPNGKGWSDIGYHFFVDEEGVLFIGRPLNINGAHVLGFNDDTIGICVAGGLNSQLAPSDTMTDIQKLTVEGLLFQLKKANPEMIVKGHRDYSEDLNNNGIIEPFEFMKACPCYNAEERFEIFNGSIENLYKILGRN